MLSKEFTVNEIAASLVPDIGHFSVVANHKELIIEKLKMVEMTLKSDTLDTEIKKNLTEEYKMLSEAVSWMGIDWS